MPESFGRFKMYQTINCVSDEIDGCYPNKYQDDIDTITQASVQEVEIEGCSEER